MIKKPLPADRKDECLRLKELFNDKKKELGLTQEKLAHALDMNQSSVSHYLNGVNPLNVPVASAFARILKIEVAQFSERLASQIADIASSLPVRDAEEDEGEPPISTKKVMESLGFITIPHLNVSASMGPGKLPEHQVEVIREITVNFDWLKIQGLAFSSLDKLAIITGDGDSMEGTFRNGDSLLVDRGITEIRTDAIYVFTLDGDLFIKRLQRMTGGALRMISDNPAYPPIIIEGADLEKVHIQARVLLVWNARKL